MIKVFIWIIVVLLITTLIAIIAKRHGVEYLIGTFVALVVISNILANKIVIFFKCNPCKKPQSNDDFTR